MREWVFDIWEHSWEKSIPGERNGKCKGPEAGVLKEQEEDKCGWSGMRESEEYEMEVKWGS